MTDDCLVETGAAGGWKASLQLCRVSNLPTVWTNVLAGSLLAGAPIKAAPYTLVAGALSFFYMGGMVLNDLCDTESDRLSRPTRPIPSGRVSKPAALTLATGLFAAGFGALALAPSPSGAGAALLLLATIVLYDRHHKPHPMSVLLIAACRFLVYAVAALAVSGQLARPVFVAAGVQLVYIVALSLVARRENQRRTPFAFPVMPLLLAGISMVDGMVLALLLAPLWALAGVGGFLLTLLGQRYLRGD